MQYDAGFHSCPIGVTCAPCKHKAAVTLHNGKFSRTQSLRCMGKNIGATHVQKYKLSCGSARYLQAQLQLQLQLQHPPNHLCRGGPKPKSSGLNQEPTRNKASRLGTRFEEFSSSWYSVRYPILDFLVRAGTSGLKFLDQPGSYCL